MAAPPKITTPAFILKYTWITELGTGEKVGTSQYYSYSGGRPLIADCNHFASTASSAWNTNCASLQSNDDVLFTVNVQDIYDTAGHVGTSTTTHAGSRAGHQPTTFACVNSAYQIAQHYRGGKPKGFWPFGIQADSSNGSDWLPTPIGAFNTGLTALAAAIDGDTSGGITIGPQQAVSFYSGSQANPDQSKWAPRNSPKPRSTAVVYPVLGVACATKIASQRRRRT